MSDPFCTQRAENKLLQLRVASRFGFRVPDTLVSQDPHTVARFVEAHSGAVIAKPVRGTRLAPLLTAAVREDAVAAIDSVSLSPTIYQECIPGSEHLRVQVFGEHTYAACIESENLDWRVDYRSPMRGITADETLASQLVGVLNALGLRMGVFDLKLTPEGSLVWLELNPQGQFLFLEAFGRVAGS